MFGQLLAYHITFGTCGTRLHGDERGTVDRRHNTPGEPVLGRIESWQRVERRRMKHPPVMLTQQQREYAELTVPKVCQRGGWDYHITACGPDHVHVLLTADADGNGVRRWLKTWLGQSLSERWPLSGDSRWWAEGGSVKWIWDEGYFARAHDYIERQRATK
jgi:REP element-mobilizing transposase RayT